MPEYRYIYAAYALLACAEATRRASLLARWALRLGAAARAIGVCCAVMSFLLVTVHLLVAFLALGGKIRGQSAESPPPNWLERGVERGARWLGRRLADTARAARRTCDGCGRCCSGRGCNSCSRRASARPALAAPPDFAFGGKGMGAEALDEPVIMPAAAYVAPSAGGQPPGGRSSAPAAAAFPAAGPAAPPRAPPSPLPKSSAAPARLQQFIFQRAAAVQRKEASSDEDGVEERVAARERVADAAPIRCGRGSAPPPASAPSAPAAEQKAAPASAAARCAAEAAQDVPKSKMRRKARGKEEAAVGAVPRPRGRAKRLTRADESELPRGGALSGEGGGGACGRCAGELDGARRRRAPTGLGVSEKMSKKGRQTREAAAEEEAEDEDEGGRDSAEDDAILAMPPGRPRADRGWLGGRLASSPAAAADATMAARPLVLTPALGDLVNVLVAFERALRAHGHADGVDEADAAAAVDARRAELSGSAHALRAAYARAVREAQSLVEGLEDAVMSVTEAAAHQAGYSDPALAGIDAWALLLKLAELFDTAAEALAAADAAAHQHLATTSR